MAAIGDRFNLKKQFTFYASYHNDPINIVIHLICIWPIFATTVVFLQVNRVLFKIQKAVKPIWVDYIIARNGKNVALLYLIFQYTPNFAATPASIEGLSFGKDIHINGAFLLVLLYIGEFVTR